ncbi:DinB family protein [Gaopeijia maritima]|uniref:DinB family protein n=1 Tax=Gaopeijia maritima TaxID=3119007 RepID=A0ABU9E928_9BACT
MPEAWLSGPVAGVPDLLQPAAHSLIDAVTDVERAVEGLPAHLLWSRPGGVASIGFHLRHIAGSADRLLTYARGEALSDAQMDALRGEVEPGPAPPSLGDLLARLRAARDAALDQYRATDPSTLLDPRAVGRQALPATVTGLLFHVAEHARRHAGQVIATAGVLRGTDGNALATS